MSQQEKVRDHIRDNYSAVALQSKEGGCCGSACGCGTGTVSLLEASTLIGYSEDELSAVPSGSNMALGCGNPTAIAALKPGEIVLDLGSGGGFDCFLARAKVGDTGYVIGVDMTPEMVKLSRKNAAESGFSNMEFRLGEIEHLPVADQSVDVIISNCVINLALDKPQVFKEAYRVLKPGGRLALSDVVATARLPEEIRRDLGLIASCIGGAVHVEDLRAMIQDAGFREVRLEPKDNSREIITSWVPGMEVEKNVAAFMIEGSK
jgi:SAM-dependent methyltransferase